MTVLFTPTPTNHASAQEFDDGDAPEATIINPLGEAAFDTATYAANRVGSWRIKTLVSFTDTGAGLMGTSGAAAFGTGDITAINGTVTVVTKDKIEIAANFEVDSALAGQGEFRIAYKITADGAITELPAARAYFSNMTTDRIPVCVQGVATAGADGALYVYLQLREPGAGHNVYIYAPISCVVKVHGVNT